MEFYGAAGPDPLKPSLFELVAQERLRDLLQPALKYVLAVCQLHMNPTSRSQKLRSLPKDILVT